jgi:hypothetical protein
MNFNFPNSFANEGECLRFVVHGDRDEDDH